MYRPLLPTEQRKLRTRASYVEHWVEDAGRGRPTSRQVYRHKRAPQRQHSWYLTKKTRSRKPSKWEDLAFVLVCFGLVGACLAW